MTPLEQQVEQQHRESESIVRLGALQAAKRPALQFRRREQRRPHIAGKRASALLHLDGVAVDEYRRAILADERIAMVHVADHMTRGVNLCERAR
jgi:hypothetical protein